MRLYFILVVTLAAETVANSCHGDGCSASSALLQKKFQVDAMRSDDHLTASGAKVPRHDLANLRVPLHTKIETTNDGNWREYTDHNECHASTPDGRLYMCGEHAKYLRYYKFESQTFTADGVPIFNDDVWSYWEAESTDPVVPKEFRMHSSNKAAWCFPDWHRPFETLENGDHFYAMYVYGTSYRQWMNVTVAKPMTAEAKIVNMVLGDKVRLGREIDQYGFISLDGRLFIATDVPWWRTGWRNLTYSAIAEGAQPCPLDWPADRYVHEMHYDPDNLNLRERYPVARYPLKDALGTPYSKEYPLEGMYCWMDQEARNLWYKGYAKFFRVIGEDTRGAEFLSDGAMNIDNGHARFMTSPMWNFESERTRAHRFPGELHTSGVDSGSGYQLPMSKGHHVVPVFAAAQMFYAEPELYNNWKAPHWDIVYLPMTVIQPRSNPDKVHTPDISQHFFTGEMVGDMRIDYNKTADVPTEVQGVGMCVRTVDDGVLKIDISHADGVRGINSPVRGFTAHVAARPEWEFTHMRKRIIYHPDLDLELFRGGITWTIAGVTVDGGSFVQQKWIQLALVFDGVDREVISYSDGLEVARVSVPFSTYQIHASTPILLGGSDVEKVRTGSHRRRFSYNGRIDNFRLMAHARSHRNVCKSAFGSQSCDAAITYHPSSTQYELGMQIKECTAETMHTMACYAAMHRVCANLVAMKAKEAGTPNSLLGALTPPGPPVSMAGVPVSIAHHGDHDTVAVACSPADHHLSVPVDWRMMTEYHPGCSPLTDHASPAVYCNLASHIFCQKAFGDDPASATGVIFEVDARAWVSCFTAGKVLELPATSVPVCSDLESSSCQYALASSCTAAGFDGGVLQSADPALKVHCFDAPASVGLHSFVI